MQMQIREFKWKSEDLAKMKPLQQIDYIVIHHTESHDVPVEEIDRWHRSRGWVGVGYHYVIRANGAIEKGRPNTKQGAHALGHNHHAIGISLAGSFMDSAPSSAQMDALEDLLAALRAKFPGAKIVRHRDLNPTSCPGDKFPWAELMQRLQGKARKQEAVRIRIGNAILEGIIEDNQTYAPVRALAEALGYKVTWDGEKKEVLIA